MISACEHMLLRNTQCHVVWDSEFIVEMPLNDLHKYNNYTHLFCKRKECVEHFELPILKEYPDEFFFKHQCSVCFEQIQKKDSYQLSSCEHIFHKGCIKQWIQNAYSCPLCRSSFCPIEVVYSIINPDSLILTNTTPPPYFTPKKIILDGETYFISHDMLSTLYKQSPVKWSIFDGNRLHPLYKLGSLSLISSWLRVNLLFNEEYIIYTQRQITLDEDYIISIEDSFKCNGKILSYGSYVQIYEWIFDAMHELYREKGEIFKFKNIDNTKLINIIFAGFSKLDISVDTYQLLGLCSIYLTHKESLCLKYLNEFALNRYSINEIETFNTKLKESIVEYGMC